MSKGVITALRIASGFLMLSGYLALATTFQFGPGVLVLPAIFILLAPLGERWDGQWSGYRNVTAMLTVLLMLIFAAELVVTMRPLIEVVTFVVILVQGYTLMHRKDLKNYHHLFLMSFLMLVASCVMMPDAIIALVMVGFLASAVCSLLLLQTHAQLAGGASADTAHDLTTVNVERFLAPSLLDRLPKGWLALPMVLLFVAALVLTSLVFVAVPRVRFHFRSLSDISTASETEFTEAVDLRAMPTPLFNVMRQRSCAWNSRTSPRIVTTGRCIGV